MYYVLKVIESACAEADNQVCSCSSVSPDNQNDNENLGNPDNTDTVSVHAGDDIDELLSEDNK